MYQKLVDSMANMHPRVVTNEEYLCTYEAWRVLFCRIVKMRTTICGVSWQLSVCSQHLTQLSQHCI